LSKLSERIDISAFETQQEKNDALIRAIVLDG
jgi:hypothetical protein